MRLEFVYSVFDLYNFLFAILIAMWLGNAFQPDLPTFVFVFIVGSAFLYAYWFGRIQKETPSWSRIAIHLIILLASIPLIIAATAFIFQISSNVIFWLILVPVFVFLASLILHYLYKIYPVKQTN